MENSFFSLKEEGRIKRKKNAQRDEFSKNQRKNVDKHLQRKRIKKRNLKENVKAEEKVKGKGFLRKDKRDKKTLLFDTF